MLTYGAHGDYDAGHWDTDTGCRDAATENCGIEKLTQSVEMLTQALG